MIFFWCPYCWQADRCWHAQLLDRDSVMSRNVEWSREAGENGENGQREPAVWCVCRPLLVASSTAWWCELADHGAQFWINVLIMFSIDWSIVWFENKPESGEKCCGNDPECCNVGLVQPSVSTISILSIHSNYLQPFFTNCNGFDSMELLYQDREGRGCCDSSRRRTSRSLHGGGSEVMEGTCYSVGEWVLMISVGATCLFLFSKCIVCWLMLSVI